METEKATVSGVLAPERVLLGVEAPEKWTVIDSLVEQLPAGGPQAFPDPIEIEDVRARVHARERQLSTGLEEGIALPHGMIAGDIAPRGVLAVSPGGVDFESYDGKPARFVLLIVFPDTDEGRAHHVALLGATIRLFTDVRARDDLLTAQTPDAALAALVRAETRLGL